MKPHFPTILILLILLTSLPLHAQWKQHTIDNTSRGADGVRLADVNNDNLDVIWYENPTRNPQPAE